jgi:hypothetical protein
MEKMKSETDRDAKMPQWALPAFSWFVSFYFLAGFAAEMGFPPKTEIKPGHVLFLLAWLFFLFLPFFKRIKIGKFLELEREVEKAKEELKEFKDEVRTNLSLISTNVNTIGNLSNQITFNLPGLADIEDFKRRFDEKTSAPTKEEVQDIREELVLEGEDIVMALARTRISIEHLLRKIVGKSTTISAYSDRPIRFASLQQMFRLFLREHEEYTHLEQPFSYVVQVCNAAIHAQRVPQSQADEALDVGARIIAVLSDIADTQEKEDS